MHKLLKFSLLILTTCLFLGCDGPYSGFDKTDNGLYYCFHEENKDAPKPMMGDVITVHMIYRLQDSILFDSKVSYPGPFRFPLDPPGFAGDIFEGLAMMHLGDSATFIVPADSLMHFGDLPQLDSGTMLYFDVKLLEIQSKADFQRQQDSLQKAWQVELDRMKLAEQGLIDTYIAEKGIRSRPSNSGLYIIPKKVGAGPRAGDKKVVEIHYSAKFLSGEKLFSSRDESGAPITFMMGKGFEIPAIEEALKTMNPGSAVQLIVPSSLAYGETGIENLVPPFSPLVFDLELLAIYDSLEFKKKMEVREKSAIAEYIIQHKIKTAPKEGGLYYIEKTAGKGPLAIMGKSVLVSYTGKFLNGVVFESSADVGPFEFVVGDGEVIAGLEMGISYMRVGGSATLIIPSSLAYESEYVGTIPPYTPLVFEVELLSVR